jgi:hypothetical protein
MPVLGAGCVVVSIVTICQSQLVITYFAKYIYAIAGIVLYVHA